jgi:TolA-binding protein
VTFSRLARDGELRTVRGELRASSGRCREATADFAWALGHQPTTATTERALFGRAACNKTLRDLNGARADYSEYLERFPSGKFAAAAEAALRDLPAK